MFPLFAEHKMNGVAFFDIGNSYEGDIDLTDLRKSTGLGVRWYSPLGPLRLEWGYNLEPRDDEEQSDWEFTIGGVF